MRPFPDGYRLEWLKRSEIPYLIEGIRRWYPDISVGKASCYLREHFYNNQVSFDGDNEKNNILGVYKCGEEIVGVRAIEKIPEALSLFLGLGVFSPEHRGKKIASTTLPLIEQIGRLMGAEFLFGYATLKIPHTQHYLETAGWQIIGFTSGYDREEVSPGVIKRVIEGIFTKVLVPEEELARPDPKNLTLRAKVLFDVLFPGQNLIDHQSIAVGGQ